MSDKIIAPVTFGVRRIAKKDAGNGTWCEFMWHGGGDARITETPKDAKTIVGRWSAEEKMMRSVVPPGMTRTDVN
jgi:hypothetical protein